MVASSNVTVLSHKEVGQSVLYQSVTFFVAEFHWSSNIDATSEDESSDSLVKLIIRHVVESITETTESSWVCHLSCVGPFYYKTPDRKGQGLLWFLVWEVPIIRAVYVGC